MCDQCEDFRCGTVKGFRHWLHIADRWTDEDKRRMIEYLKKQLEMER